MIGTLLKCFKAAAATLLLAVSAQAATITFTHSGSGSGTLDGVSFGSIAPVSFTITAIGDTSAITSPDTGVLSLTHTSASISIVGLGSFDFLIGTRTFFNDNNNVLGFSRSSDGTDLLYSGAGAALEGYDLASDIGPVAGSGFMQQWALSDVITSGGVLFFNTGGQGGSFSAVVDDGRVPEPATLLLCMMALGVAGASRRR